MLEFIKKNYIFSILLLLFLFIYFLAVQSDLWWDSAVYIGMGKYIYSAGESGLLEPARPVILPLFLGFFWKLGLDSAFYGKLLSILFSLGILILTYLITLKIFNKKIALLSAFFLSLFPVFFLFSNLSLTEIPSTFFLLASVLYLIKNNYKASGFLLGISLMTRFFQVFAVIAIFSFLFYNYKKNKLKKQFLDFTVYFSVPVTLYLIVNYFLYSNPFYPFLQQVFLTLNTGTIYSQPIYFYFLGLFRGNFLVIFSVLGICYLLKKPSKNNILILTLFLFSFVPYLFIAHKEMRLLIPILPFLFILSSYGIFKFVNNFKKNKYILLSLFVVSSFVLTLPQLRYDALENNFSSFQDFSKNHKNVWISNPKFIIADNAKAELMYYPTYSSKLNFLLENVNLAENVLIDTCDLVCEDNLCKEKDKELFDYFFKNFNIVLDKKVSDCNYYIFSR